MPKNLNEGSEKKGGINQAPQSPKPSQAPRPRPVKDKKTESPH